MPIPTHLLERAYQLINANQLQNAELVLDAVVRVDPRNVEAWKTYLMIRQSQSDLDWLKDRILKTRELGKREKVKLIEYYHRLTKQLNEIKEDTGQISTPTFFLQEEKEEYVSTEGTDNGLELLGVFDYPEKNIKKEILAKPRSRPRRRKLYNPFTIDFVRSILKTMSRNPVGKKFASYLEEPIALVYDCIKNPWDAFARFSESPHYRIYIGVSLLILFVFGVRIVMSSNFLGYIVLGIFVIGSWRWLSKHENYSSSQTRIYLHENTSDLPMVEEEEEVDSN
jgi:hypothetical protein